VESRSTAVCTSCSASCSPKAKRGQNDTKCSCPIWRDGELNGKRHRQSLKTASGNARFGSLPPSRTRRLRGSSPSRMQSRRTRTTYSRSERARNPNIRTSWCTSRLLQISRVERHHAGHRRAPGRSPGWPEDRSDDFAQGTADPLAVLRPLLRPSMGRRESFEENQTAAEHQAYRKSHTRRRRSRRLLRLADAIGNSSDERLRALATVLLMRCAALRISDVATLERDRVQNG